MARIAIGKAKNMNRPLAMPNTRLAMALPLVCGVSPGCQVGADDEGVRTAGGICAGGTCAGGTCAGVGEVVPAMTWAGLTTTVCASRRAPQFTQKLALSSLAAPHVLQYTVELLNGY